MRSVEQMNASANAQINEQQHRLKEMAVAKHQRVAALAGIIGRAAAKQTIWPVADTAEEYLERLGIDLTKI